MRIILILLISGINLPYSSAQNFWDTTASYPGSVKTAITLANDSCLLVGLSDRILRSYDNGITWDSTLSASPIYYLFTANSGRVFAGGKGKVFYSDNMGTSWDSILFNNSYPVLKIIQDNNNDLFAITGDLDINLGYVGAGVYHSDNNGIQWTQRNNGLGNYLCIEQIAYDHNGRLYLGVADEYVTGNGGLFISDNSGLLWQHVDILVDGRGIISDQMKVGNFNALSVSPQDSVYISFSGVAVNVAVSLNIHKSSSDVTNSSYWNVNTIGSVNSWWDDWLLSNIHFAQNGDWYSSMEGSSTIGGTYYSVNEGITWQKKQQGLFFDQLGRYNIQRFAENDSGTIFMIQILDNHVYRTDTSMLTHIDDKNAFQDPHFRIYPNPVKAGNPIQINFSDDSYEKQIIFSDVTGKIIFEQHCKNSLTIYAPDEKGIFFLTLRSNRYNKTYKIIIY